MLYPVRGTAHEGRRTYTAYPGALSGVETKLALRGLRARGWLEAVTKSWGERILYIPVHRLPDLYDMLLEQKSNEHDAFGSSDNGT